MNQTGIIRSWSKDLVSAKDNIRKALEMVDVMPKTAWNENVRMCLTNALKHIEKGRIETGGTTWPTLTK